MIKSTMICDFCETEILKAAAGNPMSYSATIYVDPWEAVTSELPDANDLPEYMPINIHLACLGVWANNLALDVFTNKVKGWRK